MNVNTYTYIYKHIYKYKYTWRQEKKIYDHILATNEFVARKQTVQLFDTQVIADLNKNPSTCLQHLSKNNGLRSLLQSPILHYVAHR